MKNFTLVLTLLAASAFGQILSVGAPPVNGADLTPSSITTPLVDAGTVNAQIANFQFIDGGVGTFSTGVNLPGTGAVESVAQNSCISFSGATVGGACQTAGAGLNLGSDGVGLAYYVNSTMRWRDNQGSGNFEAGFGFKSLGGGPSFWGSATGGNYVLKNNSSWGIWTNASDTQMIFDLSGLSGALSLSNTTATFGVLIRASSGVGTTGVPFATAGAWSITSGFCSSPSITSTTGSASFQVTVGTSCTGVKTGVVTNATAAAVGYSCTCQNNTSVAQSDSNVIGSVATSTAAVSLKNYARTTGAGADLTAGDKIFCNCTGAL